MSPHFNKKIKIYIIELQSIIVHSTIQLKVPRVNSDPLFLNLM